MDTRTLEEKIKDKIEYVLMDYIYMDEVLDTVADELYDELLHILQQEMMGKGGGLAPTSLFVHLYHKKRK